jgi:hypothetical protein
MEGALLKKVVTTALFCRPNKRSPNEPSETEVNADISSFQWRPFNFFSGTIFVGIVERRLFGPVSRYRSGIVGRYRYPPSQGGCGSCECLVTRHSHLIIQ